MTHSYGPDGAAVTLRRLIGHWTGLGWTVDALCSAGAMQQYKQELAASGANAIEQADLRAYDVAVVNSLLNADKIDGLAKATQLPIVLWAREGLSILRHSDQPVSAWVRRFARCSRVVYETAWQRDEVFRSFAALLPPSRIAIVPIGVDPVSEPRSRSHADQRFRVVCVGSVNGRKRQGDLARVVQKLAGELAIECEFIGDLTHADSLGPGFAELVTAPSASLRWTGALPHAETLARLSEADLFCLPSSDESLPSAPLEAAARGLPVVISALGPYRYIGWKDGENCLMHGVADLVQLEAQIRRVATQPLLYERLRIAGKLLADSFSTEAFLRNMTDCVVAAAGERAR